MRISRIVYRWLPNLTANLGARHETATVPNEVNGLVSNLRDIYSTNLNVGQSLFRNPTHYNFEPLGGSGMGAIQGWKRLPFVRASADIFDVLLPIWRDRHAGKPTAVRFRAL